MIFIVLSPEAGALVLRGPFRYIVPIAMARTWRLRLCGIIDRFVHSRGRQSWRTVGGVAGGADAAFAVDADGAELCGATDCQLLVATN
jgi:hypothetical protein